MGFEKVASITLILLIVIFIIWGLSDKIYAVVKPALNWKVELGEDSNKALASVYNLYNKCKESGKVDCVCNGNDIIKINENDKVTIGDSQVGTGIKISAKSNGEEIDFKIVNGVGYCRYPVNLDENQAILPDSPITIYEKDGKLLVENLFLPGEIANPFVLYKIQLKDKKYICLPVSNILIQQLPKVNCFD